MEYARDKAVDLKESDDKEKAKSETQWSSFSSAPVFEMAELLANLRERGHDLPTAPYRLRETGRPHV